MGKIRTSDGRLVDPFDIQEDDIRPWVIVPALAKVNRFTGQSAWPYSVAQHTFNLYNAVPAHLRRVALVHDFAESWFNDLASPIKRECGSYKLAEIKAMVAVFEYYGISEQIHDEFDEYDKRIYKDERNALFPIIEELGMGDQYEPLGIDPKLISEIRWQEAERNLRGAFIEEFGFYAYHKGAPGLD